MKIKLGNVREWGWPVLPIGVVVGIRLLLILRSITLDRILVNVWIVGGWVLGWLFLSLEQSKWVVANWPVGKYSPVRNVLVCAVVGVLGLWVITSSASSIAAGFVWGVGVRLFSEMTRTSDLSRWFAVFARPFSPKEHKVFMFAFGIALGICGWLLIGY